MTTLHEVAGAQPGDPYRNLTLDPYEPVGPIPAGAMRPTVVLARTLEMAGAPPAAGRVLRRLQERFGHGRLVWSYALREGAPAWELYVYNGMVGDRVEPEALRAAMEPDVGWDPGLTDVARDLVDPFSIDLHLETFAGVRRVSVLNGYVNAGAEAALSYALTADDTELSNFYRRFRSEDRRQIVRAISRTLHLRVPEEIESLGPDEHLEVHIAQKTRCDGIYWVGVPSADLIPALERMGSAAGGILDVLTSDLDRIRHLRLDLGIDVRRTGTSAEITKVGLYGLL